LINISDKIEKKRAEALICFSKISENSGIDFFVVGASARDILFSTISGVNAQRATLDHDLAIRVRNWSDFNHFIEKAENNNHITRDKKKINRLVFSETVWIDLIPFGEISDENDLITWPPENRIIMSVAGFKEAFEASIPVKVSENPSVSIKVCTLPALALLKIISWYKDFPLRNHDAKDLRFIMRYYLDAGNIERIYSSDSDLLKDASFDYDRAGSRLLGRDISAIVNLKTYNLIVEILERETNDQSDYNLAQNMMKPVFNPDPNELTQHIHLLKELLLGIKERSSP